MAKKKDNDINKTNAMRLLEQGNVPFRVETYEYDEEHLGGEHVAAQVSLPADQIFKTLVVRGEKQGIMVFCIPVTMELDLKKAAKTAKDKKIEMTHVKELLGLTGYIRGGCSPGYGCFKSLSRRPSDRRRYSPGQCHVLFGSRRFPCYRNFLCF